MIIGLYYVYIQYAGLPHTTMKYYCNLYAGLPQTIPQVYRSLLQRVQQRVHSNSTFIIPLSAKTPLF